MTTTVVFSHAISLLIGFGIGYAIRYGYTRHG